MNFQTKPHIRTVGCFLEYDGKFLILHRRPEKSQGDKWGLPAGKAEQGESDEDTIIRELKEETGYEARPEQLEFITEITWDFPEKTVTFPVFRIVLTEQIEVKHNPDEHQGYKWVTGKECYAMQDLIHGLHDLLAKLGYEKRD